jgi:hypothetical protein
MREFEQFVVMVMIVAFFPQASPQTTRQSLMNTFLQS